MSRATWRSMFSLCFRWSFSALALAGLSEKSFVG